ncbi:MAG: hypothetical protein ACI90V_009119 [Bacillariaceae sp.]|jgi:hypothetical protein
MSRALNLIFMGNNKNNTNSAADNGMQNIPQIGDFKKGNIRTLKISASSNSTQSCTG